MNRKIKPLDMASHELYKTLKHNHQNPDNFKHYIFLKFPDMQSALNFENEFYKYLSQRTNQCMIPDSFKTQEGYVLLAYPDQYEQILTEYLKE